MTEERPARFDARVAPFITAVVVGVTYAFALDRDVGFWDTGELQTVPYILGLMHPTGYPAEILIGWLFTHALPFGDVALRMNLLCMLCVVVAAACCCALAQLLGARAAVAGGAALCFAFTPVVWAHATHADVTDPALALCALTLLAVGLGIARGAPSWLFVAALCAGLALGTHGMVVWFLPLPVLWVVASGKRALLRVLPACAGVSLVVAAALYAYLPLRSALVTREQLAWERVSGLGPGMPFWDLGHPSTLSGFLDVVSGRSVDAPHSLAALLEPAGYLHDVAFLYGRLGENYAAPILVLVLLPAVFGAWGSWQRGLLFLPLVLVTPFAANFAGESDVSRYYTFPLLCLWVLAALGLSRLAQSVPGRTAGIARGSAVLPAARASAVALVARAFAVVLVAFTAFEAYAGRATFAQRDDVLGRTYIAHVLAATDPRAIVIAEWVYATPLAYAAYVEKVTGERTVVAGSAQSLASHLPAWTRERAVYALAEQPPAVSGPVVLVRAMHVNPDAAHDPKLYRLGAEAK